MNATLRRNHIMQGNVQVATLIGSECNNLLSCRNPHGLDGSKHLYTDVAASHPNNGLRLGTLDAS